MTVSKADFAGIYDQPDALDYYCTLGTLDYEIPQHGADVLTSVLAPLAEDGAHTPTVLDVCCSYGVGGALLGTDLRLDDLVQHYRAARAEGVRGGELEMADRRLLNEHRRENAPRVLGLDVAANAAEYAVRSEWLDAAFVENLERDEPSPALAEQMNEVDVISTTGGVGYITEKTFARLVDASDNTPWIAAFCLRAYDYRPEIESNAQRGLVTEKSSAVYSQRRFLDGDEQAWAIEQVEANGLDPADLEADGRYYANFYLSRPAAAVAAAPLEALLAG